MLTVTGRNVLDRVVEFASGAMNSRSNKQWLLFCENGLNMAASYASRFDSSVVPMDTVMSRMCRFADNDEQAYKPVWPGYESALVVEDYDFLPLDIDKAQNGPFSPKFTLVSHEEFPVLGGH